MNEIYLLLILADIGITLLNVAILGIGVKLYTDQRKQMILSETKNEVRRMR